MAITMFKERLTASLRRWRLLQASDYLRMGRALWTARRRNMAFAARHPHFAIPPRSLVFDAHDHVDWENYLQSGLRHAQMVAELINQHAAGSALRVLEWGCGPARVIRHLGGFLHRSADLYGADYNRRTIAWCRRNIDGVEFLDNDLAPPLPLPPERLDCVYALSVFTHLSEAMHDAWRGELARVLRPGGLLILTTHGDCFRNRNLSAAEKRDYDEGKLVVRGAVREGKKFYSAFHSPAFVQNRLLRGFDLVAHIPRPLHWVLEQDVWIARKPDYREGDTTRFGRIIRYPFLAGDTIPLQ